MARSKNSEKTKERITSKEALTSKDRKSKKEEKEKVEKVEADDFIEDVKNKKILNPEKALFINRFVAFILDVMIVSMIASFISYPFVDAQSLNKLNESSIQVMEDYTAGKIDTKEYFTESNSLMYETARQQGMVSLVTIFLSILYFVVFQIKNGGQTLGKKLLRIKVVSTDQGDLTMNQMIFRSLIINSILINMINFGVMIFASKNVYFSIVGTLSFIQFMITVISGFMVMFGERRQGIHDRVAHTEVIQCNLVREMEKCEN